MDGKVVIVTGGGSGLGLALAEGLAANGAEVHCLDKGAVPVAAWHVAREAAARSRGCLIYHQIDVSDAEGLEELIVSIADVARRIDGLITAAGIHQNIPALEYTTAAIDELIAVNYKGSFVSAASCARQMIKYKTSGSICFISSISGIVANQGLTSSVYNSSKAAICQLTRNLAMEWAKVIEGRPIRVNALCPGNILTPNVQKHLEQQPHLQRVWECQNMLGRISHPHEYQGAALFLLSDASSFMTGSQLIIDGGSTAW